MQYRHFAILLLITFKRSVFQDLHASSGGDANIRLIGDCCVENFERLDTVMSKTRKLRKHVTRLQNQYLVILESSESHQGKQLAKMGLQSSSILIESIDLFEQSHPKNLELWRSVRKAVALLAENALELIDLMRSERK